MKYDKEILEKFKKFGANIKTIRVAKGISPENFEKETGIKKNP